MHRLSAIDEPVDLTGLLAADEIEEILRSAADMHGLGLQIVDRAGAVLAAAGWAGSAAAEHRVDLVYNGEIIGEVLVGPGPETGPVDDSLAREVGRHIALVTVSLVHAGYARHLTSTVHVAAIEEAFGELQDKNKRLAAAIERLEEVDRLKSNFLATISHELRTPLTSIIGYSEMLIEGLAGNMEREQRDYVETILSKADQLLQLITGILDVSLVESKSLRLVRKPVSILELIDGVASTLAHEAERRGIVLRLPTEPVPRAFGDPRKLRQVVLHLLSNAIKFSPDGGDVTVEVAIGPLSPEDRSTFGSPFWKTDALAERFGLRLSVVDTGIGIASEQQPYVFEPFFQADMSSTREFGGTGLGLSLARSYVEAHGGFIWVDSVAGRGSAFTVSLPAVAEELEQFVADAAAPEVRGD